MPKVDVEANEIKDELSLCPKLPNMNEFSPGTLGSNNIKWLLSILYPSIGNKDAMIESIITKVPKIAATTNIKQKKNRANNVLIGMSQCGLLKKEQNRITGVFSGLADRIHACSTDKDANNLFAIHLLQECYGLELFDVISIIRGRSEAVALQSIREELRSRGFIVTENEGNISKIRQWLEASSIIDNNWIVDDNALHSLVGATFNTTGKWNGLSRPQRIFLTKLKYLHDINTSWITVRQIKSLCELEYGRNVFPEGHLRKKIIEPLVADEWIEAQSTGSGRGGDSAGVRALPQLLDIKINLPIDTISTVPIELRDKLAKPLNEIFNELKSKDTYIKGVALELLSLRIARDIGLYPVCFRERSSKTQGAEVDIIANGIHLHYSRWLIQCKNTKYVHVSDIAKEVGMAVVLKAHVIVIVSTGKIGSTVRQFADGLAVSSALQAVLIDGELLNNYRKHGADVIIDHLKSGAFRVLKQKETQVLEYNDD